MDQAQARELFKQCMTDYYAGRHEECLATIDKLEAIYPNDATLSYQKALSLIALHRHVDVYDLLNHRRGILKAEHLSDIEARLKQSEAVSKESTEAAAPGTALDAAQSPANLERPPGGPIYFKHSGRFNPITPLLLIPIGAIVALLFAVLYILALDYVAFVYIRVVITVLFGYLVGFAVMQIVRWGKIRNQTLALLIGLGFGLFALYWPWVFVIGATTDDAVLSPLGLLTEIARLSESGTFSFKGRQITGLAAMAVWAAEAGIILGFSTWLATNYLRKNPFCEKTKKWARRDKPVKGLPAIEDPTGFTTALEAGDFSRLWHLPQAPEAPGRSTELEFHFDPKHEDFRLISIKAVEMKTNSKGKEERKERWLARYLFVNPEIYDFARQLRGLTALPD